MSRVSVWGSVLYGICLAAAAPQIRRQTSATRDSAVLFLVAHRGSLKNVEFDPILFDQVPVNQGSGFDNATGVFTAPRAGAYQFVFSAQLCRESSPNNWYFMVNGDMRMRCHAQVYGGDTTLNTCYYMEELRSGDRVWVKQGEGSCAWASSVSKTINFSGILLSPMLGESSGPPRPCPLVGLKRRLSLSSAGQSHSRPHTCSTVVSLLLILILLLD